ncbi:hypothetical protein [Oceanispirochaeta sp.]|jgi:hypothetical protein|uniref:hypothetical protein n=1 Tax=Oceanispirochaeta sp. TaxID=2035350 RepID=UPI00260C28E9|nr:hypothetical protein [Oceanispirochaeta sp.]MDA3956061.1 hypothetical protein [Oceanispirochaeta sp.]
MTIIFHRIAGILLLLTHSLFLIRSWTLIRKNRPPLNFDRWLMGLSQILLPVTIISGLPGLAKSPVIHTLFGCFPIVMMFILSRRSIRRKRPLLLPLLNGLFIAAAFLTGVFL